METMKKRWIGMIAAAVMVMLAVFSFTACKVQSTKKQDTEVKPEENENASIQLTVEGHADSIEKDLVQTWANKFMAANKDVNIKVNPRGGISTMSDLVTLEQEGNLPDISWTAGDQHSKWSGSGYFQDLSNEENFPGSKAFFDGMYESVVANTHYNAMDTGIWFVPRDYNRLVVFINKTAFEKCGVAVPSADWTFDDLLETSRKLMAGNGSYECKFGLELRNWAPVYTTMMKNFGATYVDEEGYCALDKGIGTKDCPALNVWTWYDDALNNDIDIDAGGKKFATMTNEGSTFKSFNPKTKVCNSPMVVNTYAHLGKYIAAANSTGWVLDVLPFPAFTSADNQKGYVGAGCSGYAITKACTDATKREWAWKFLQYCMSEQGYDDVASLGVVCPVLKSMADKGEWTNFADKAGNKINYKAFVATNTEDIDLNYQNVLSSTDKQADLIGYADTFWKNLGQNSFAGSAEQFRKHYESTIAKK